MKFSIKDFFSKCGQFRGTDLVTFAEKSLMESFIFSAVHRVTPTSSPAHLFAIRGRDWSLMITTYGYQKRFHEIKLTFKEITFTKF